MSFVFSNPELLMSLLVDHLRMVGVTLVVATAIALPLGAWIASQPRWSALAMGGLGIIYTVPSLALIILLVPVFGLNETAVIVALILYAQVILVRNVVAGLQAVSPAIEEAARGLGMSAWQRWWQVRLPLALPVMLAGERIAAVTSIGIAAIGAKFSAGGLGRLLFDGIAQNRMDKIWVGALALSALAFVVSGALWLLERAARCMPEQVGR